MSTLILTVREALRYKGKEGQLAWIGHRLAGLGTLLRWTFYEVIKMSRGIFDDGKS